MRYLFLCLPILLSSCGIYQMPKEDEFSTVPLTNNPHVTRDPGRSLAPPGVQKR